MFDINLYMKKTTSLPNINNTSVSDLIKQNYNKYLSSNNSSASTITLTSPLHHYNYSSNNSNNYNTINTECDSVYSNSNRDLNFNLFSEKLKRIKIKRLRAIKPLFQQENYNHVLDFINKQVSYNAQDQHEEEIKSLFMENPSLSNKIFGKNYTNKFDKLKTETKPEILNKERSLFNKTKYSSSNSVNTFFNKYRQLSNLERKHPNIHISPSLAFVKACKKEKIIPNAIGLIKRDISDDKFNYYNSTDNNSFNIDLSNCKAGNDCIKAISASIKILNEPLNALMLSSNRLNQDSMDVLFKAITMNNKNVLSKLQKLDLSYNSISTIGSEHLIKLLSNPQCIIEYINLEHNNLHDANITSIVTCITRSHISRKLKYINLNSNCISDESSNAIANMLEQCDNLQFLMLSRNNLNNKGGAIIISKLKLLSDLRVLDLSYNNFGNHLIKEPLFEEIVANDRDPIRKYHNYELNEIKSTMNYSFKSNPHSPNNNNRRTSIITNTTRKSTKKITINLNSRHSISKIRIPPHKVSAFAKELCEYFNNTSTASLKCMLVHLDISHNHLPYEDCEYIATYIKSNHSILGIHVDGNEMNIDSLGFIHPNHSNKVNPNQHYGQNILSYSMNTNHLVMKSKIDAVRKIRNKNNCWICEGWKETEFIYTPTKDEESIAEYMVVKLHLSFENYESCDMIYNGKYFSRFRMCPPGYVEYFYTVDTKAVTDYGNETVTLNPKRNKINIAFTDEYFDELNNVKLRQAYSTNDNNFNECSISSNNNNVEYNKEITITTIGKRKIKENLHVIDDTYRTTLKFCEPRPIRQINRFIKPRTPWTFPISIWAKYDYNFDGVNSEYLDECFEHDFKRCQLEKEFITEKALYQVKDILREHYKDIIDCYKNLASYSGFTTWQISQNVLVEWINKCQGLCDKKYDINGVFLVQTGICANALDKEERVKHNNKNLGDNIVRHQFMALIAKVPKDKYIRSKY